jgi:hypothetical protein
VAYAGDVNGDGLSDFLVGAASAGDARGVAWLYLGRELGSGAARMRFDPPAEAEWGPPLLAGLGDSNGNGLSDMLIAPSEAPVALIYGRPNAEWPTGQFMLASQANALFSGDGSDQTVSQVGDVNGDGLADMLIGDPDTFVSRVFLLYGQRDQKAWALPPTTNDLTSVSNASFADTVNTWSRLGISLAPLGDVDSDGKADFAFGQPGSNDGLGRVAFALSQSTQLGTDVSVESATQTILGTSRSPGFGRTLSVGDCSGDRRIDILAGVDAGDQALLFQGDFDHGIVSGIAAV